jgi:hypothetical protein
MLANEAAIRHAFEAAGIGLIEESGPAAKALDFPSRDT